MKEGVEKALNRVRPYLIADGGNVELVSVDEENKIVKIRLTGGCGGCPYAQMTLKGLIEKEIKREVPDVKKVVSV